MKTNARLNSKKGFLGVDTLIIILILLGLLAIIGVAYLIYSGNLSGLLSQIKNFMRFGN